MRLSALLLCAYSRRFTVMSLMALWVYSAAAPVRAANPSVELVTHSMGGWSPGIQRYQMDLLRLLLANTGPYQLEPETRLLSGSRWRRVLSRGDTVTSFAAVTLSFTLDDQDIVWLSGPFYKSLLGLRKLIVRKQDLAKFARVRTLADLQAFTAGQGSGWPDAQVYRNAGVDVVQGASLNQLLPMLSKGRFDFIALSVLEVDEVFADSRDAFPDLAVAEALYVYYPAPVYLAVSVNKPVAVERLKVGVDWLVSAQGRVAFDALFTEHFPQRLYLKDARARLIALTNPTLPPDLAEPTNRYFYKEIWGAPRPVGAAPEND